ncbi:hypothetical protein ACS77_13025 [Pseudomonas syringae]|uniref:Uncharacterized protein n=1 Tax=Pseudomonas syringae TaxID=317 RepID=A0A0L1MFP4_PSESX|nr:hypothetical protein ACS77_13025 [Pseudomonas syringae]
MLISLDRPVRVVYLQEGGLMGFGAGGDEIGTAVVKGRPAVFLRHGTLSQLWPLCSSITKFLELKSKCQGKLPRSQ